MRIAIALILSMFVACCNSELTPDQKDLINKIEKYKSGDVVRSEDISLFNKYLVKSESNWAQYYFHFPSFAEAWLTVNTTDNTVLSVSRKNWESINGRQ